MIVVRLYFTIINGNILIKRKIKISSDFMLKKNLELTQQKKYLVNLKFLRGGLR